MPHLTRNVQLLTRLPLWAALLGIALWNPAGAQDLDEPVDIILVWIGDRVAQEEPVPEPAPVEEPLAAEEPAAEPAPTLDLDTLETRLRKTKAIGLFTKLELKNQVGELLEEVTAYHANRSDLELEQLEEHFDLLMMKLLLLLQDDDPELHHDIADARPFLWDTLSNPQKFAEVNGP